MARPLESTPGAADSVQSSGPAPFSGTVGIALCFAALYRILGDDRDRSFSLEILEPLRHRLANIITNPERARSAKIGTGGMVGLGAFAYSFWRLGGWLDDARLQAEARALLSLFDAERLEANPSSDVIAGAAGGILAVLALAEPGQEEEIPLSIAIACARLLNARQLAVDEWFAGWHTLPGFPPLSGFGHGAAGIAYALLRLYKRTRDPEHLSLARKALAFEHTLYSPEHRNWRDVRRPGNQFMTSWCHGAPGIALGRVGILDVLDTPEIRDDIRNGLASILNLGLAPLDHLCCGNMGLVEVLLCASHGGWRVNNFSVDREDNHLGGPARQVAGLSFRSSSPPATPSTRLSSPAPQG